MIHETAVTRNKKTPRGITRFPGITQHAKALGVNRVTLYKMLMGYPSHEGLKTLRQRYDALIVTVTNAYRQN
jgi:DNA-binding phage protein